MGHTFAGHFGLGLAVNNDIHMQPCDGVLSRYLRFIAVDIFNRRLLAPAPSSGCAVKHIQGVCSRGYRQDTFPRHRWTHWENCALVMLGLLRSAP